MYDELAGRARAGDARAACRLAAELERCQNVEFLREQRKILDEIPQILESMAGHSTDRGDAVIESSARMFERGELVDRACTGLPAGRADEAFDWLLRAVDAGHLGSAREFIRRPLVPAYALLRNLDRLEI